MGNPKTTPVVLSVAPAGRGIGYAVFERETEPIDWGIKTARINKNRACERHVESLISFYQPDLLVLEEFEDGHNRLRAEALNATLAELASHKQLDVVWIKKTQVKTVFEPFGGSQKLSIARTICTWLPELKPRMPKYRKPWMPESHSMALFEALALGLTYYYLNN